MKTLSIIIPHYNCPDKLTRLLNSIPNRPDIQIIVVDDLSNKMIDEYDKVKAIFGERVEFYKNTIEHKSAGGARNVGLEHAIGKWLLFCDSDDYLTESFEKILLKYADREEDIIFFPPSAVMEGSNYPSSRSSMEREIAYAAYNAERFNMHNNKFNLKLRYCWYSPCSRFIKADLVKKNKIRFDCIKYSNDIMFSVRVGHLASKVSVGYEPFYIITEGTGTLTSNNDPDERRIRDAVTVSYYRFCMENMQLADKLNLWGFADLISISLKYNNSILGKIYYHYCKWRYGQ